MDISNGFGNKVYEEFDDMAFESTEREGGLQSQTPSETSLSYWTNLQGSYRLAGDQLIFQQFLAVILKRFLYVKRNWRALISQIFLPALFVCVAMSVALTVVLVDDLPPLVLSPAQYYNECRN